MKMKAKKLPPSSRLTALAPASVFSRKIRSGMSGASTRVSMTTKAASRTTEGASSTTAPQAGRGTATTVVLPAPSVVLLAAFVVIEARVEAPLIPLRIFRLKTLAGANAVSLLLGGSFFAFIFIGTLYMQQVLGYSALKAGLAWLATSLTSVAFAGLSQALVTRGSAKLVMAAGMAMIGGGI